MAIQKRFIHFKKFSDFNSKKLSANEANTQYTVGVSGEIQNGEPDILYQSYIWIKDTQQQWTHGRLYNGIDTPIVKGEAENSAVLKGGDNQVISERGVAIGNNTFAGQKAYRFSSCNISAKRFAMIASFDEVSVNFAVGDVISIINDKKYPDCTTISLISEGSGGKALITVNSLPFNSIIDDNGFDAKLIYVSAKPESGNIDLGINAYAEGENTYAQNWDAHAEGRDTHAYGEYSHAEGRETSAQYAAHSEGLRTTASGHQSHAEGNETVAKGISSHSEGHMTEAKGDHSHSEGYKTHAFGVNSHAEGNNCYARSSNSHVEGEQSVATGNASHSEGHYTSANGTGAHAEGDGVIANGEAAHAEGYHTITYNDYEHAQGKYNKNNKGTIHSVGIGSSNGRKNAHEILDDGRHFIYGIGGYDGTNPTDSEDLATLMSTPITDAELDELFND